MKIALTCCLLLACIPTAHAQVVVLAHAASGDFVVVQNRPSPRTEAMQRANAKGHSGGWKLLLSSATTGYGAMFCFRPKGGGDMRYFIADGKVTRQEAIADARAQANAAASNTGAITAICGNWHNRNLHPLEAQPGSPATPQQPGATTGPAPANTGPRKPDEGRVIETIKQEVREQVTCDPKQKPCPPPNKPAWIGVRG